MEGIADWVRLRCGLGPPHWRRGFDGGECFFLLFFPPLYPSPLLIFHVFSALFRLLILLFLPLIFCSISILLFTTRAARSLTISDWDRGYEHTAYFLEYLEKRFGKCTVQRINEKLRLCKYETNSFWVDLLGQSVDQLYCDYAASEAEYLTADEGTQT